MNKRKPVNRAAVVLVVVFAVILLLMVFSFSTQNTTQKAKYTATPTYLATGTGMFPSLTLVAPTKAG